MTRLAATLATDVRVQFRNGFYAASVVVVIASIVLLRWLPTETAELLLPVLLLGNVLMNSFYFVGGLLLLERLEGTFLAQSVTPLRLAEYLASKVATLTGLSLLEGLLIAVAVLGADSRLLAVGLGIALAALLFCLAGVAAVLRYASISEFLLPSVLYALLLTLPVFAVFGVGSPAWYLPHPIFGPLTLIQSEVRAAPPFASGWLLYAVGYPLLWSVPLYAWSRRALARARSA